MRVHDLKACPDEWMAAANGGKPWEFRKDDGNFKTGDMVILSMSHADREEFPKDPVPLVFKIGYVQRGPALGIPYGCVIFTLEETSTRYADLAFKAYEAML